MPRPQKDTLPLHKGAQPPRISNKLMQVFELVATKGETQMRAAEIVGLHYTTVSRALARPGVRYILDQKKLDAAQGLSDIRDIVRNRAFQVGLELLNNTKNEAIRAKMVELFTREASGAPTVIVNNSMGSGAYEYASPKQRIVDITPADPALPPVDPD